MCAAQQQRQQQHVVFVVVVVVVVDAAAAGVAIDSRRFYAVTFGLGTFSICARRKVC